MMPSRRDTINSLWAQADPDHISAEDYANPLRKVDKYLARNLLADIRAEAIPPLKEDVKRELILGDVTSNKP